MQRVKDFLCYYIATGFHSGLSPYAPGTAGSFLAVALVALFWPESFLVQFMLVLLTTILAIYTSGWLADVEGLKDPSIVVIDEVVGQFMTFLFIPVALMNWKVLLVGFLLFRIFDIWKPWPIRRLEKLPGGWGIVMDDILAGVFANILLRIGLQWM